MAYCSTLRRTLATLSSRRNFFHCSSSSASLSRLVSNPNTRFLASALLNRRPTGSANTLAPFSTTGPDSEPLKHDEDARPKWAHPEAGGGEGEEVVIDGCDFEHWLVIMGFPEQGKPSEEEMINAYVSTLAKVLGSEEEAKKKIYSVSTVTYTGFGALLSREMSQGLKGLPGVLWVLPDSYLDVPNKDYGGDLYVDGKVIRRPEYRFPNGPRELMDSEFDDNNYNEHIMEDELENKQLEMQAELLDRLRITLKTQKKEPRLRSITLERPPEGNEHLEGNEEETEELFGRVRERTEVVEEVARQSMTEELEGTKASNELHEIFSKLRQKLKNAKIETVQSRNEVSDWPSWDVDYLEQTEDPNKPRPDLNKLKEAIKSFRLGSELSRDEDVDRSVEETDCLRENSEPIKSKDSELPNQQPEDFEEIRGIEGSEDLKMPRPDLDKLRGIMDALRREPVKSGNHDNLGGPVEDTEGSEAHFPLLDGLQESAEHEERDNAMQDR